MEKINCPEYCETKMIKTQLLKDFQKKNLSRWKANPKEDSSENCLP